MSVRKHRKHSSSWWDFRFRPTASLRHTHTPSLCSSTSRKWGAIQINKCLKEMICVLVECSGEWDQQMSHLRKKTDHWNNALDCTVEINLHPQTSTVCAQSHCRRTPCTFPSTLNRVRILTANESLHALVGFCEINSIFFPFKHGPPFLCRETCYHVLPMQSTFY